MRHKIKIYELWTGHGCIHLGNLSTLENIEKAKEIYRPLLSDPEDFFVNEHEVDEEDLEKFKVDILDYIDGFDEESDPRFIIHLNDEKGG